MLVQFHQLACYGLDEKKEQRNYSIIVDSYEKYSISLCSIIHKDKRIIEIYCFVSAAHKHTDHNTWKMERSINCNLNSTYEFFH